MPSPESFGGNAPVNNSEAAESLRETDKERGNKTNEYEALLQKKAKLEEMLRKAGVDPETVGNEDEASKAEYDESRAKNQEVTKETEVSPSKLGEKVSKSVHLKKVIAGIVLGLTTTIAAGFVAGSVYKASKAETTAEAETPEAPEKEALPTQEAEVQTAEQSVENSKFVGENAEGVPYDYGEYADREGKHSYNAYRYDQSENHGNREATEKGILETATMEPEALASYAYSIFTDEEKEELGIKGLTMTEIDEKFDQEGGGELYQKLLSGVSQILRSEDTDYKFYYENGTEHTNYMYFIDDNGDGNYTTSEMHLGYDTKYRKDAPQVDIYRTFKNEHGSYTMKMLDLNEQCGYQPNYEIAPSGVAKIDSEKPVDKTNPPVVTPPSNTPGNPGTPTPGEPTPGEPTPGEPTPGKPTPGKPNPGDPDVPDKPKHDPKNEEAEKKNAGEHVTQLPIDNNVTPPTTEAQDRQNFEAIEKQREQEAKANEEAARVAAEQAAAEARAAAEAEARRNAEEEANRQAAENAARAAAEEEANRQAAEAQQENHDEIQQQVEEAEQRERAQEAADANSGRNEQESESHSDDTARERADIFANGDF